MPRYLYTQSILPHTEINEFRCYEVKTEESEKPAVTESQTQNTSDLSHQWLPGVQLRHSVPSVQWLSGCRASVAEHWRLKPEVSWV